MIPFVDLKRQYLSLKREIDPVIARVVSNGTFIMGENVREFEREYASYSGARFGIGTASGSDALYLVLKALGIGRQDEVIVPSFTFVSSVDCVVRNDARPVFVDVDPETYVLDASELHRLNTDRVRAIIPVHLYGQSAGMDALAEFAQERSIPVIEDACQAHGAEYKSAKIGCFGLAACYSFYPSKNLGAYGDAGMITTSDEELASRVAKLREYGQERKYHHQYVGLNSRLDEIQAAILRVKLKWLDKWNDSRRENAMLYRKLLGGLENEIMLPVEKADRKHVYHLFVVRSRMRDRLQSYLSERGIQTGIHYPVPVHMQQAYSFMGHSPLPITERLADEVLSLPMFPELTKDEITQVTDSIREFYR